MLETRTDSSFPTAQFQMDGYTIPRRDRDENGGGLWLYVREDAPSTLLKTVSEIKAFYVELNIRKKKWLLCCSYNPNKTFNTKNLAEIAKNQDLFSSKYNNFILLGDFNSEPREQPMRDFWHVFNLQNIIKGKTYFKNPSCVDLFITNRFQNFMVIERGLSDFHKMSSTVMKVFYKKQRPKIAKYQHYCHFDNELFINEIKNNIEKEYCQNKCLEFGSFKKKVDNIL